MDHSALWLGPQAKASRPARHKSLSPEPSFNHRVLSRDDILSEVTDSSSQKKRNLKTPHQARTFAVFAVVQQGLRDRLRLTNDETQKENSNGICVAGKLQIFGSMQYQVSNDCQKLKSMLSKVEHMLERYTIQNQMREAAMRMTTAYSHSTGVSKKASIANLQRSHKQCSKEMCAIETHVDVALGQVQCRIAGVSGFSRVLAGDVYEAVIRIGDQKWRSRGRVSKDGSQKWNKDVHTFDIRSDYAMTVKVFECKTLGRQLLGERHCDVLGLVSAIPQVLAIEASTTGTIKLNIAADWNPLAHIVEWLLPDDSANHRQREHPLISHNLSTVSFGSTARTRITHGQRFEKQNIESPLRAEERLEYAQIARQNDDMDRIWPPTLMDALNSLASILQSSEDIDSPILRKFNDIVPALRSAAEAWRLGSSGCTGCKPAACTLCGKRYFDESPCDVTHVGDDCSDFDSPKSSRSCRAAANNESFEAESLRSAATSATADSGVHSVCIYPLRGTLCLQPEAYRSSLAISYNDLDIVAVQHVACCLQLLQRLHRKEALQAEREKWLRKLGRQARLLCSLCCLSTHGGLIRPDGSIDVSRALDDTCAPQPLREFWSRTARSGKMHMTREQFIRSLERLHIAGSGDSSDVRISRTYSLMTSQIIGSGLFPSEVQLRLVLTLNQLMDFMTERGYYSLEDFAADVAAELWLLDSLRSGNSVIITRAIHSLQDTVPADEVVRMLLALLASLQVDECVSAAAGKAAVLDCSHINAKFVQCSLYKPVSIAIPAACSA